MVKFSSIASVALGSLIAIASVAAAPHSRIIGAKKVALTHNNLKDRPIPGDISYHGGKLMVGEVDVYFIYYGKWANATANKILENFVEHVDESPYFGIEKTYYQIENGTKTYVKGPVVLKGTIHDNYSKGKELSDQDVIDVVASHLGSGSGKLPASENAIYVLMLGPDVTETSGYCEAYCAYHENTKIGSKDIKIALVVDLTSCMDGCAIQNIKVSPNNNPGIDATVSALAHELMEAISDPDPPSGWVDDSNFENADKCAYTYGHLLNSTNGAKYNMVVGGMEYLVQQNWNAKSQKCQVGTGGGHSSSSPEATRTNSPRETVIPHHFGIRL